MSSIRGRQARIRVAAVLRTRTAEIAYNAILLVLAGGAVLLLIAGGSSADRQGLWTIGLTAAAAVALLFVSHRLLTREH